MKIVDRKTFLALPAGTVYSKYSPCVFADFCIKDSDAGQYENDFLYSGIVGAIDANSSDDFVEKCDAMERGVSVAMDFSLTARDGLFDDDQLFSIYEPADVQQLIVRLTDLLSVSSEQSAA